MSTRERVVRTLAVAFFTTTLLLSGALAATFWNLELLRPERPPVAPPMPAPVAPPERRPPLSVSPLLLDYQLQLPGRGEVFPAMAASKAREYWPVAVLTISNNSDQPVLQIVSAHIDGWTRRQEQTLVVGGRQSASIELSPAMLPAALQNTEIKRAALDVRVVNPETGITRFAETHDVFIHGGSEIFWGRQFANAQAVARWVTPHDPAVLALIARSKRWMPNGRMAGYITGSRARDAVPRQVRQQAEAVFRELKRSGLTYVNSVFSLGSFTNNAQRIRLPHETLRLKSANCMDVTVAFASALENLDMEPVIVIVPGHGFGGVRLGPGAEDVLYFDLTVLPRGNFADAVARAKSWLRKTPPERQIVVDVGAARAMGVYPL